MSKDYLADEKVREILYGFKSDSTDLEDSNWVRVLELRDGCLRTNRWFKRGYCLTSVQGRRRNRYYGIYKNSFSEQRSLLDEPGRTSLTGFSRTLKKK